VKPSWFTKARRAQSAEDFETWIQGGAVPTLNAFDNGDTRATVLIFYGNRVNDIRMQGDVINTLQARMGTGGNNMPIMFSHTQGLDVQPSEKNSPTLRTGGSGMAVAEDTTVRRLTPVECERLQGFPDNWTADQADTHRYKQMGNAVAVPCVEWIVKRLVEVTSRTES